MPAEDLLMFIVEYGDESVFPNLRIALKIMLTIADVNNSGGRGANHLPWQARFKNQGPQ